MADDRIKSTRAGRCQDHLSRQSIKAERGGFNFLPRQHEALPSLKGTFRMMTMWHRKRKSLMSTVQPEYLTMMEWIWSWYPLMYGPFCSWYVIRWLCDDPSNHKAAISRVLIFQCYLDHDAETWKQNYKSSNLIQYHLLSTHSFWIWGCFSNVN